MSKKIFIFILGLIFGVNFVFYGLSFNAFAAGTSGSWTPGASGSWTEDSGYILLAPLPNLQSVPNDVSALQKYIPYVFKLAIGISAVITVCVIIYGGIEYMMAESLIKKNNGKERIQNAIFGLIFVITAWLILNTINPDLTTINLEIEPIMISQPVGTLSTSGKKMTDEEKAASTVVRALLYTGGVEAYRDPCTEGQTRECVNLNGLETDTIKGLIELKDECGTNCEVTVTGGTEGGHAVGSDHYDGTAVDLRSSNSSLNSYILEKAIGEPVQTKIGPQYILKINGKIVKFTRESSSAEGSTGDHWHVLFAE